MNIPDFHRSCLRGGYISDIIFTITAVYDFLQGAVISLTPISSYGVYSVPAIDLHPSFEICVL